MLDQLDHAILTALQQDARRSHRQIANLIGSTQPTVTSRVRRMEDAGIIQGYSVRLDEEAFEPKAGKASVVCHWCKRRTSDPVWAKLERNHPFCCPTCKAAYIAKHDALSKDL